MGMVLIAMASTYFFINHLDKFIILDKWSNVRCLLNCIHLLVCIYFTILFTIAGLHMETTFNVLFGLFLFSLLIFMSLVDKHQYNIKIPNNIVNYGWTGIKYIVLSGICWIVTENLCHKIWFIKYLFGHVWWHVFVSYGGYLVSLIPNYLTLKESYDTVFIRNDYFGIPYIDHS